MLLVPEHRRRRCGWLVLAVLAYLAGAPAWSAPLAEPLTLASEGGVLDLLMIARPASLPLLAPYAPVGWVYEICRRPAGELEQCPDGASGRNYYGGTRLALAPGDTLKVHLVNRLPLALDAVHALEPGREFLRLNPTNLHTHGLLVSPHLPTAQDPSYGDSVFVLTFNPDNGVPATSPHLHAALQLGATDYTISIPLNHPPGLYWFHPHAHGLSANQIAAGLAGIITIGSVGDSLCFDSSCVRRASGVPVRHLILKDAQVRRDGSLQHQQRSSFCAAADGAPPASAPGSCAGQDRRALGGEDFSGGRWFFTLNGQLAPTLTVASARGEIWRLTNASASVSYDLSLHEPASGRDLLLQVLSLDGVSVAPTRGLTNAELTEIAGPKLRAVPCPGTEPGRHRERLAEPLCATRLLMMPSTRADVWVSYRNRYQRAAPGGHRAVLQTRGFETGPHGDAWPAVELATVEFGSLAPSAAEVAPAGDFLPVRGDAKQLLSPTQLSAELSAANTAVGADASCRPLAAGHRRRVYFNLAAHNGGYGLGYEELDARGRALAGSFQEVAAFDPARPTVCRPLGPGNTLVKEVWELVNLQQEDHNFHTHQAHFRLLSGAEIDSSRVPTRELGDGVLLDNVPLAHADGSCLSVDDWHHGLCTAHPVIVEMSFAIAGDFVYHCHILAHEDSGMMAMVRIRPNP